MLHYGHELDGVVSQGMDSREDVSGELLVSTDAPLRGGYADVSLVDPDARWLWGRLVLEDVGRLGRGVPESCLVDRRDGQILCDALDPGRNTLDTLSRWYNHGYLV